MSHRLTCDRCGSPINPGEPYLPVIGFGADREEGHTHFKCLKANEYPSDILEQLESMWGKR